MRHLLLATVAIAAMTLASGNAMASPQLTGDINFTGSDSYTSTGVTFVNPVGVSSETGNLTTFGTCTSCITATSFTYNPFTGPLTSLISGTNGSNTFSLDLDTITSTNYVAGTDLDIEGTATLNLTGYAPTAGTLFFSTQGPNDIEVSFSATAVPVPEPASLAVLGFGVLGLGFVASRKRSV